jgi:gluconolactonase
MSIDQAAERGHPVHFDRQPVSVHGEEWKPSPRWPDPAVRVLDPRFKKYHLYQAAVERLATGFRWTEGPVWIGDGGYLLWSDIPNNRIMRWDEQTGATSIYRSPSNLANGNTRDRAGRLVTCEHETRRVTRTEYDGSITVLADRFEGKRLNSPNDIVVKSDGSIWFTDPMSGIRNNYMGRAAVSELPTNLYRIDPETGEITLATAEVAWPNGLCFSPDETILYVVSSSGNPLTIQMFDVVDGRELKNLRWFVNCGPNGTPDGIRCDIDGNVWAGWGTGEGFNGVYVFAPDGTAIGHVQLPERCHNLCFGGIHRNRLFMAAGSSIYSLYTNAQGATVG